VKPCEEKTVKVSDVQAGTSGAQVTPKNPHTPPNRRVPRFVVYTPKITKRGHGGGALGKGATGFGGGVGFFVPGGGDTPVLGV